MHYIYKHDTNNMLTSCNRSARSSQHNGSHPSVRFSWICFSGRGAAAPASPSHVAVQADLIGDARYQLSMAVRCMSCRLTFNFSSSSQQDYRGRGGRRGDDPQPSRYTNRLSRRLTEMTRIWLVRLGRVEVFFPL